MRVVRWMKRESESENFKKLISRAVQEFPDVFRGSYKANIMKASRWWRQRDDFSSSGKQRIPSTFSITKKVGRMRAKRKAGEGRGKVSRGLDRVAVPKASR